MTAQPHGSGSRLGSTPPDPTPDPTPSDAVAFWQDRYAGTDRVWSGRPNAVLVREVADLPPGRALDLGCGEGGDAVWLAEQGWQVTAVDIATNALARVTALAAERGVAERITTQQHDLAASTPTGTFELVSACFLQTPVAFDRPAALRRVLAGVVPGGRLLLVDHAAAPPWSRHQHDHFPTPGETLAGLALDPAQWDPLVVRTRARRATGPDGQEADLLDGVLVLRRTAA
jgi:chemotaxis protein methyltransferase CheR